MALQPMAFLIGRTTDTHLVGQLVLADGGDYTQPKTIVPCVMGKNVTMPTWAFDPPAGPETHYT